MIYFAQPIAGGPIKIGCSGDVPARIRQLEAHYGQPLAVLATQAGGFEEERAIHARFAHLRLGRTEQFQPAPDLMAYIGRPLLVGANPEAVETMPVTANSPRPIAVAVRGLPEWKAWLEEGRAFASKKLGVPLSLNALIGLSVAHYLRSIGFTKEPPER